MVETTYSASSFNCPAKIAVIADFHNSNPDPVIHSISSHHPDLICIPGDAVNGWIPHSDLFMMEQLNVIALLSLLSTIAPTYFSLGNHERMLMKKDIDIIENTGVHVLDNAWISLSINEYPIILGGLTSGRVIGYNIWKDKNHPGESYPRQLHTERIYTDECPRTEWLKGFLADWGYHILLCHHPEYYSQLPSGIDLTLAGHTHGGQIRIGKLGLYAPGQGWFPKYSGGLYSSSSTGPMIVSRGLANLKKQVPRFGNPTEIVYIE